MRVSTVLISSVLLVGSVMGTGCTTYHSPRALTAEERSVVEKAGLSDLTVSVVVDADGRPAFRDDLVEVLKSTRLFKTVNAMSADGPPSDLVVHVRHKGYRLWCLTGPGALVIPTLGLIPVKLPYDTSMDFEFSSPKDTARVSVAYQSKLSMWWGSSSSLLALSRNWTLNKPDAERHRERLAYVLALRREEIRALLKP